MNDQHLKPCSFVNLRILYRFILDGFTDLKPPPQRQSYGTSYRDKYDS